MLSDTVFRRSVLKNITEYRSGSQGILSAVSNGRYAVIDACNALACRGGEPEGINAAVTIPDSYDEKLLKKLIADIDEQCRTCGTHIEDVTVSTSQHIRKPVITASAFGRSSEGMPAGMQKAGGNLDIIASGSIGMSGIMNVLDSHMDEAKKVYADSVINAAAAARGSCLSQTGRHLQQGQEHHTLWRQAMAVYTQHCGGWQRIMDVVLILISEIFL